MQGIPEKNPQLAERLVNAAAAQEEALRVLKTTKFVNIANLNEYIQGVSNRNCRVVVQSVEQGSAIAMQLDKALEEMQKRKATVAGANAQQHFTAPAQEQNTSYSQHVPITRTAPIIKQERAPVQPRQAPSVVPAELERHQSFDTLERCGRHRHQNLENFDLREGVSSLLMQMKQISLATRITTEGPAYDRDQQPTIDTYISTSLLNSNKSAGEFSKEINGVTVEPSNRPVEQIQNVKHEEDLNTTQPPSEIETVESVLKPQEAFVEAPPTTGLTTDMHQITEPKKDLPEHQMAAHPQQHCMRTPVQPVGSLKESVPMGPQVSAYDIYTPVNSDEKLVKRFTPPVKPRMNQNNDTPKQNGTTCNAQKTMQYPMQLDATNQAAQTQTPPPKRTPRTTQTHKVGPRRKAVVVGCSYFGDNEAVLRGPCNDAMLFATTLVTHMGFDVDDVLLLIDSEPADIYMQQLSIISSSQQVMPTARRNSGERRKTGVIGGLIGGLIEDVFNGVKTDDNLDVPEMLVLDSPGNPTADGNRPTRANILKALRWLTSNTSSGDCGVFYFSGHSVQMDDMSGWEGEGYDEGIVSCDYMESSDPSRGIIPAQQIKQLIQSVDKYCQMTMILDTVGMQTALDPAGRVGPWKYIKGAMLRGIWPLADATGKVNRAMYDPEVWRDVKMQQQLVRPKFMPLVQVDCAAAMVDGFISSNNVNASSNVICIAAAPFQEVAVEALFKPMDITEGALPSRKHNGCEEVVCHGVFTYCLLSTLLRDRASKRGGITVAELVTGIHRRCKYLKATRLPKLQQVCEVTIHPAGLATLDDFFLSPWGGRVLVDRNRSLGIYPYKALEEGIKSFLSLPEAWMQLHNEGRAKAVEQREKFGRMRSAVVNVSRMVTADARNMMFMNQQPYNSRAPSSNIMLGHVPPQQRVAAGNSWCGQAAVPQPTMPLRHDYVMNHYPMMQHQVMPPVVPMQHHHYHPMAHDYAFDQMMYKPQHVMQDGQHQYVMNHQAMFYNQTHAPIPPQFGGAAHTAQSPFLHYAPPQPQPMTPTKFANPCRSNTSSMFDKNAAGKPMVPRNNTSSCKLSGYKLAEPITTTLISQLPISHQYY
ncbi:Metacaspase-1 [Babesia divergens]|uniref:Metacaspase-1 n=1 Tax=Babesia divergens TaxID=32595 RepID=A0AAD9G934_BABDI|nr:Metacaspase-1 [Babesia divergens]